MTFSEALEANKTCAVVDAHSNKFKVGELIDDADKGWVEAEDMRGTWTLVREPRRIWVHRNKLHEANATGVFSNKKDGDCVEFVEVIEPGQDQP